MMFRIVDSILAILMLAYIVKSNVAFLTELGGAVIFMTAFSLNLYFSYAHRIFQAEFTVLNMMLFLLVCLNYNAFVDSHNLMQFKVIWLFNSIIVFILEILIIYLNLNPVYLKMKEMNASYQRKLELTKRISHYTVILPITCAFFIICSGAAFEFNKDAAVVTKYGLRYTFIVITLIWSFMFAHIIMLKKIDKRYLKLIIPSPKTIISSKIKKYILFYFVFILFLGLLLEIQRGFFIVWMESVVFYFLAVTSGIMIRNNGNHNSLTYEDIEMPKVNDMVGLSPGTQFKHAILIVILGTIYFVTLMFLFLVK